MDRGTKWLRVLVALVLSVGVVVPVSAWSALALWFRLPVPTAVRVILMAAFGIAGLLAIAALFRRAPLRAGLPFALAFGAIVLWWGTIEPPRTAQWAADVSRQTTGRVQGSILTLTDVRQFTWHEDGSVDPAWVTRSYDLDRLRTLDVFLSYWAGPQMAHVIMSFGFEGGQQLAWSIEVRRREGGEFSPVADLFKANALVVLAADERDVVGVRSNVRGEDVRLFRLRTPPAVARALLLEYVDQANALVERPEFYNSITTNCTTTVVRLIRAAGRSIPFDWRLIVNGYLPGFLYETGAVDTRVPLRDLVDRGSIAVRARAAGGSAEFPSLIRVGVPSPF